jgi:hypothetical protein
MRPEPAGRRREITRRGLVALAISGAVFIFVILFEAFAIETESGYWIEMFNGATWPSGFAQTAPRYPTYDIPFYLVIGIRTVLNLGAGLTAVIAIVWFVSDGPRRYMMRTLDSVLRIRDVALTGYLIKTLSENGVSIPNDALDKIYKATREFGDTEVAIHFENEAARSVVEPNSPTGSAQPESNE